MGTPRSLSSSAGDEPLRVSLRRWVLALVQARVSAARTTSRGPARRRPPAGVSTANGRGRCHGARHGAASPSRGRRPRRASGSRRRRTRLLLLCPWAAAQRSARRGWRAAWASSIRGSGRVGSGRCASGSPLPQRTTAPPARSVWRAKRSARSRAGGHPVRGCGARRGRRLAGAPDAPMARGPVRRRDPRADAGTALASPDDWRSKLRAGACALRIRPSGCVGAGLDALLRRRHPGSSPPTGSRSCSGRSPRTRVLPPSARPRTPDGRCPGARPRPDGVARGARERCADPSRRRRASPARRLR